MAKQKNRIGWKKIEITGPWACGRPRYAIAKLKIIGPVGGIKRRSQVLRNLKYGDLENKSRCESVKVLRIEGAKTGKVVSKHGYALRTSLTEYRTGKITSCDRPHMFSASSHCCGIGIHFFWRRKDAAAYRF